MILSFAPGDPGATAAALTLGLPSIVALTAYLAAALIGELLDDGGNR